MLRLQAEQRVIENFSADTRHLTPDTLLSRPLPVDNVYLVQQELNQIALDRNFEAFRMTLGQVVDPAASGQKAQENANSIDIATRDFLYIPLKLSFYSNYKSIGDYLYDVSEIGSGLVTIESIDIKRSGDRLYTELALRALFTREG
ncbi:MAG: hypothetical protein ACRD1R_05975 [Acidobacteriota bacterium]